MRNFIRALRFAWPWRYRLAASVVFALLAAVLWSLNFTAIYPILKIFGTGENLQTWVDKSIDQCEKLIEVLEKKMADLKLEVPNIDKEPDAESKARLKRHLSAKTVKVEAELKAA